MNSNNYVVQVRVRFYLIGIRNDVKRKVCKGVPLFPDAPPAELVTTLEDIIVPLRAPWKAHPPEPADGANRNHYDNVINAYGAVDVNPFITPVIVDFESSPGYSSFKVDACPTITKTRGSQKGYWCSTKGGPLDVLEMSKLQGWATFPYRESGMSESAAGGALGNGMTMSLVRDLIPHILFHSSQITYDQFVKMKAKSNAFLVAAKRRRVAGAPEVAPQAEAAAEDPPSSASEMGDDSDDDDE